MIFDSRPSIVGHRGFGSGQRGGYRENTVASCLAAVACGLSWVELDVYRTATASWWSGTTRSHRPARRS